MSMITFLLFVIVFLLLGVGAILIWTMQQRIEKIAVKTAATSDKVREGEQVIIENFTTVEKRFARLEHEIKSSKHSESRERRKEIRQTSDAIQRRIANQ